MDKEEFLQLMNFPVEWKKWDMYPDTLFKINIARYEIGHEDASEHDRNGAFHWWLKQEPSQEILKKLLKLTYLDPEEHLAADVRSRIRRSINYSKDIE